MSAKMIRSHLQDLYEASEDLKLCMIVSSDGLVMAHHGDVRDADRFGAYFLELKRVCEKIITELDYDGIDEIYIRSKSGAITLFPIFNKGYLACLSSVNMNAGKVQMMAWKYVRKINELL